MLVLVVMVVAAMVVLEAVMVVGDVEAVTVVVEVVLVPVYNTSSRRVGKMNNFQPWEGRVE